MSLQQEDNTTQEQQQSVDEKIVKTGNAAEEFGGREGLEPTRYGDWEKNGRCIDF